jgi:hypothetical protein
VPFLIAATGPRGLALTARFGQGWVTYGDPRGPSGGPPGAARHVVRSQLERREEACDRAGRPFGSVDKVLLQGLTSERPLDSVDAFVEWAGHYQKLGITELVLHWPVPESVFDADPHTFERIAVEGPTQLD